MKINKPQSNKTNDSANNYSEEQKHIKAAIDLLGKKSKHNQLARESIANLSVVLLDLKQN